MKKFILQSQKFEGEVVFGYDDDGRLVEYTSRAELSEAQITFLFGHFPFNEADLKALTAGKGNESKVVPLVEDYSFDEFWDAFAHKVGNKGKAEKLWEKLTPAEQTNIMAFIPSYLRYVSFKKIEQTYPETFLNQRRWENKLPKIY